MSEAERERVLATLESEIAELFRAAKNWNRQLAQRFEPPLPLMALGMLRYVRMHGPLRAGDIAQAFEIDKAVVSRQLGALRELGLVEQREDPADRRATLVEATPAAHAQFDRVRGELRELYLHVVDDWSQEELEVFTAQLERFRRALPR